MEEISHFCRVIDTPVFGLLATSALGFKARVDPPPASFVVRVQYLNNNLSY